MAKATIVVTVSETAAVKASAGDQAAAAATVTEPARVTARVSGR